MSFRIDASLESKRLRRGDYASQPGDLFGAFSLFHPNGTRLYVLATDGSDEAAQGWEHVSVSTPHRVPSWDEMCFIKELFWEPEDAVVEFHPPRSVYVNYHPRTLHLWRHRKIAFPVPDAILVGPRS